MGIKKNRKTLSDAIPTAKFDSWGFTPTIAAQKGPGSSLLHYNETLWPINEAIHPEIATVHDGTPSVHQIVDLDDNHLFVWCMLCSALLLIEYPVEHRLPYLDPSVSTEAVSAAVATICRSCKRKGGGNWGSSHLNGEYFQTKKLYTNMRKLACRTVKIPMDKDQNIRFVSMEHISASLTDKCVLLGLNFASVDNERRNDYRLSLSSCFI